MSTEPISFEVRAPEMSSQDYPLVCHKCKKDMGVLTLIYFGVKHHMEPIAVCRDCVDEANSRRLEEQSSPKES